MLIIISVPFELLHLKKYTLKTGVELLYYAIKT